MIGWPAAQALPGTGDDHDGHSAQEHHDHVASGDDHDGRSHHDHHGRTDDDHDGRSHHHDDRCADHRGSIDALPTGYP